MRLSLRRHATLAVPLILAVAFPSGCTTLKRIVSFRDQLEMAQQISRIDGRIDAEGKTGGNLVVVLSHEPEVDGDPLIGVDSYVRVRPGTFAFRVQEGRYRLGAYEDRNRNGLVDLDERVSRNRDNPIIEVGPGEDHSQNIVLQTGSNFAAYADEPLDVLGLVERTPEEQRRFSLWSWSVQGEICEDLDDAKFGPEAGSRGLWEIMEFLNDGIAGVYFLEPYDPSRIPVLFVHGISGYPQQFSTLIESIDRDRYQPWFYFFPSGFGLDGLSNHLATLLERLAIGHGFEEIAVVAHSMGGLVARGAILKAEQVAARGNVRLFISISTPWGGDVNARNVDGAPIKLPLSFHDMNPSSDYLRRMFYDGDKVRSLLPAVEFHLVYGFKMSSSKPVADDGTVTVASQTRTEAQDQAATQRAYDHGHVGILHAPEVATRLNWLLSQRFD